MPNIERAARRAITRARLFILDLCKALLNMETREPFLISVKDVLSAAAVVIIAQDLGRRAGVRPQADGRFKSGSRTRNNSLLLSDLGRAAHFRSSFKGRRTDCDNPAEPIDAARTSRPRSRRQP